MPYPQEEAGQRGRALRGKWTSPLEGGGLQGTDRIRAMREEDIQEASSRVTAALGQ